MNPVMVALEELFEVWDAYSLADLGPHMTCGEADTLANLLRVAGRADLAESLILGHAEEDDEGDSHYYVEVTP